MRWPFRKSPAPQQPLPQTGQLMNELYSVTLSVHATVGLEKINWIARLSKLEHGLLQTMLSTARVKGTLSEYKVEQFEPQKFEGIVKYLHELGGIEKIL
jgi:hypothetical protein